MESRNITYSESRKPTRSPMDLDVGRLDPLNVLHLFGVAILALFVGSLGGLLFWLAVPQGWQMWAGWRMVIAGFGGGVATIGSGVALLVARLGYAHHTRYEQRLQEWHELLLELTERNDGVESEVQLTQFELSANHAPHALLVALSIQARIDAGEDKPWAVRAIEGQCWIGKTRMGDVPSAQAEEMGRLLADLGLITDRAPRKAGRWAASGNDEIIQVFADKWAKVR